MTDGAELKLYYTEPRKFISNNGAQAIIKMIDNDVSTAMIDFQSWTNSSLMRLMNTGDLLVGRSSDSGLGKLQVYGGADIAGGDVYLARDTGNVLVVSCFRWRYASERSGTAIRIEIRTYLAEG